MNIKCIIEKGISRAMARFALFVLTAAIAFPASAEEVKVGYRSKYELNKTEKTATLTEVDAFTVVSIPGAIVYEDTVYSVTKIASECVALGPSIVVQFIPKNVEKIESKAFSWFGDLEVVSIPESVREIAGDAFEECSILKSILNFSKSPQAFEGGAFPEGSIVYVPQGAKSAYENDGDWGKFHIEEIDMDAEEIVVYMGWDGNEANSTYADSPQENYDVVCDQYIVCKKDAQGNLIEDIEKFAILTALRVEIDTPVECPTEFRSKELGTFPITGVGPCAVKWYRDAGYEFIYNRDVYGEGAHGGYPVYYRDNNYPCSDIEVDEDKEIKDGENEEIEDGVNDSVPGMGEKPEVKVLCQENVVTVSGASDGCQVSFFNTIGETIGTVTATNGEATLTVNEGKRGDVVIIVADGLHLKAILP